MKMQACLKFPNRQRGAAALTVCLLLMLGIVWVAFYANRSLLLEQKMAANEYRAARAFEMAEAGLQWAGAMLNDPRPIGARCQPLQGTQSFRELYAPVLAHHAVGAARNAVPQCVAAAGSLDCRCPSSDAGAATDINDAAFVLSFSTVPGEPNSIKVTSHGCVEARDCTGDDTNASNAAYATVNATLRIKPLLRTIPPAVLTAGGAVAISGLASLQNIDSGGNGMLVDAGGSITVADPAALRTRPGSPVAAALIDHDQTLAAMASTVGNGSALFDAAFAASREHFEASAIVKRISASSAEARGRQLLEAQAQGYVAFVVDGDLALGSDIGSPDRPVVMLVSGSPRCTATCHVYGFVFVDGDASDSASWSGISLHGAAVVRGGHRQSASSQLIYDRSILQTLHQQGLLVRVPGSWIDS